MTATMTTTTCQKGGEREREREVITLGFMVSAVMDGALLYDMERAAAGRDDRAWRRRSGKGGRIWARSRSQRE